MPRLAARADLRGVAPSILSADFARLAAHVREVVDAGARIIHCDVMDGVFVPPLTFGPMVVSALREALGDGVVLDVHLMVDRPERRVKDFAAAGADVLTVHAEATPHVRFALDAVRDAGVLAGVAVNPGTPVEVVRDLADQVDLALCMTVNPGWGGQRFIAGSEGRVRRLAGLVPGDVAVQVDGGVDATIAGTCAAAGATTFVAGNAVFGAREPGAAYRAIAQAARCG